MQLQNPRVDTAVTTLPLSGRVWTRGNRLFVNVQGLSYNPRSFIRIRFDVRDAPVARAPQPERPRVAPERSPVPKKIPYRPKADLPPKK